MATFSMHVLIIPSWYPKHENDNDGCFFREQAIAICRHGVEVGVIAPMLRPLRSPLGRFGIDYECDEGVHVYRGHGVLSLPISRPVNLRCKQWLSRGLLMYARYVEIHGAPDVIHIHCMLNAGLPAMEIHRRHGIPFVVTEHSSAFARGLVNDDQLRMAQSIAEQAARRFAVSQSLADLLGDELGSQATSWEVMPNMVSERFLSAPLSATTPAGFTFINICLQAENKRVDLLIRAFAKAFSPDDDVVLHLGGDGDQHGELVKLAEQLGIRDRVRFLGMLGRDEVIPHILRSNALVLCSRLETFGVVAIEALALGRPVVATRCGGPQDIVTDRDGLLVPVDDMDALAEALKSMHEGRDEYPAAQLRQSCRSRFSEHLIAGRLVDVYRQALSAA